MGVATVAAKESLIFLRSARARWFLVIYLVLLALIVVSNWPAGEVLTLKQSASKRLLYLVGYGQLALLLAMIPGVTAGSILVERTTGSLELLQSTRLGPTSLVLGKWLGAMIFSLLLMSCGLPMIALCRFLGALDAEIIVKIYGHLAATSLWAGMLGLAVSSLCRSTHTANLTVYMIVLAVNVLPPIPTILRLSGDWPGYLLNVSPAASMTGLLEPDLVLYFVDIQSGGNSWGNYAVISVLAALGLAVPAWIQLAHPFAPPRHRQGLVIDDRREILRRKLRFPFILIDPQRRRRFIGSLMNPVFARELRSRMLGQATTFLRVFCVILIGSLFLTLFSVVRTSSAIVDSVRILVIASQVVVIGLLTPPLTSTAVSHERELGTLEVLRLTRVGPWRLLLGKWMYALLVASFLLLAAAPMWYVIFEMQRVPASGLGQSILVIVSALLCSTTAGLAASSLCRSTSVATGVSYILSLGILFGTLVLLMFVDWISPPVRAHLLAVNPVVASMRAVSLRMFWELVERDAWMNATVFLLGSSVLFLVVAYWRTRRLFATG